MRQVYTPIVAVNQPCVSKTTPLCINVVVSPGKVFAPLANSMFPRLRTETRLGVFLIAFNEYIRFDEIVP